MLDAAAPARDLLVGQPEVQQLVQRLPDRRVQIRDVAAREGGAREAGLLVGPGTVARQGEERDVESGVEPVARLEGDRVDTRVAHAETVHRAQDGVVDGGAEPGREALAPAVAGQMRRVEFAEIGEGGDACGL